MLSVSGRQIERKNHLPGAVCLVGTISSGKTTAKDKVIVPKFSQNFLIECIDEPINEWMQQGIWKKYFENPQKYAFLFELNTLADRARHSQKVYNQKKNQTDLFIMERDLLCSKIFYELSVEDGLVSADEQMVYNKMYDYCLSTATFLPDLYVYLRCDLETVISRQKQRARENEKIDRGYQQRLIELHDKVFLKDFVTVRGKNIPVLILDKPIDLSDERSKDELVRLIRMMLLVKNN